MTSSEIYGEILGRVILKMKSCAEATLTANIEEVQKISR